MTDKQLRDIERWAANWQHTVIYGQVGMEPEVADTATEHILALVREVRLARKYGNAPGR